MAKAIMIQGTMSNVGKSLITAGLCRIFKQDGYRVAPFKSQNMALNAYITEDELEMGRAQAVQAEACGIAPDVRMNPILLKPTTDMVSQVIINGRVVKNMKATEYFKKKMDYIPVIEKAYKELSEQYDIIVIEGAGSPAEINLKQNDIVNMGMAEMADAPVLLVGDIDRGGVFAQLAGTLMFLDEEEQDRVQGMIINKFRGDKKILEPGLEMLQERCGKSILGVVPYANVDIEEEDSLAESLQNKKIVVRSLDELERILDIVVIRLPHISNFTDFNPFALENTVSVRYVDRAAQIGQPDAIFLPGTKNTIEDLRWLRAVGLETAILRCHQRGSLIFGICGGYQILGNSIEDMDGMECKDAIRGMGLLPMKTVFGRDKTKSRVDGPAGSFGSGFGMLSEQRITGYEMHMGKSIFPDGRENVGAAGDCRRNVMGTYVHGIFEEDGFRSSFVKLLCREKGIALEGEEKEKKLAYQEYKGQQFDKLARVLRENLDIKKIYQIMGIEGECREVDAW